MRKKGLPDLSENSEKSEDSRTSGQRQFDWGPPASKAGDTLKDWLVYFCILILLAGGVFALLDINASKDESVIRPAPVSPPAAAVSAENPPLATSVVSPAVVSPVSKPAPSFFVQLGAFADEASAREIFNQLNAEGFAPTLAEPDAQFEIYRIFVGPYPDESSAEAIAEKLNAIDFHCFVIEQP